MTSFLTALCVLLSVLVLVLVCCLFSMRRAVRMLREDFIRRLSEDTNVGIDSACADKEICLLAAELDKQLKVLRQEHLRYVKGDRELKEAVTNMSHDLRTPLTAICGYLDMLEKEEMSPKVREYLGVIGNRVQAMKGLAEELFRYSVVLSAGPEEKTERLSLNAALEDCIVAYYSAFKEAGIAPEIEMPEEVVYCQGKKQVLSRILSNIVSNAIKYSDGDFRVVLTTDGIMQFENRAEKLDEVQVGRLFDRFFTVENARNSTGLGLSIAKHLTEEMGGAMSAEYEDGMLRIWVKI
ncbi:MAG: HAMP domain-containing histidine kinase [Lachnospiraceae bacterium]|nr:HAMP domain-containing histidine kinase [Lachnospiraceae bacterium]